VHLPDNFTRVACSGDCETLIKREGYSEYHSTWEPEESFVEDMIEQLLNPFLRGGGDITSIITCVVPELVSLTPYCKEGILSLGSWFTVELI